MADPGGRVRSKMARKGVRIRPYASVPVRMRSGHRFCPWHRLVRLLTVISYRIANLPCEEKVLSPNQRVHNLFKRAVYWAIRQMKIGGEPPVRRAPKLKMVGPSSADNFACLAAGGLTDLGIDNAGALDG
jgi:hypothetical protein